MYRFFDDVSHYQSGGKHVWFPNHEIRREVFWQQSPLTACDIARLAHVVTPMIQSIPKCRKQSDKNPQLTIAFLGLHGLQQE